jgi:hypothetical protein
VVALVARDVTQVPADGRQVLVAEREELVERGVAPVVTRQGELGLQLDELSSLQRKPIGRLCVCRCRSDDAQQRDDCSASRYPATGGRVAQARRHARIRKSANSPV